MKEMNSKNIFIILIQKLIDIFMKKDIIKI